MVHMASADHVIRLHADEHPLVGSSKPSSLEEHCIRLIHRKAYEEIEELARGKVVLDLGCNDGYGTKEISRHAAQAVGVDVSERAIERARSRYPDGGIDFRVFDGLKLPFGDGHFDLVTSFQVIEHIVDVDAYLSEIYRVLRPSGLAVITTPNAAIRLDPGAKPWNRFHVHEYTGKELKACLQKRFPEVAVRALLAAEELYAVEYNRCQRIREIAGWRAGARSWPTSVASLRAAAIGTTLRMLPDGAVIALKDFVRTARSAVPRKNTWSDRFSTADLFYSPDRLDGALDLMAVCRKTRATSSS
jgi:ubiquinone/menaquinone biosynthesis C-methylase UbiE